jgi:hypothetical protein
MSHKVNDQLYEDIYERMQERHPTWDHKKLAEETYKTFDLMGDLNPVDVKADEELQT